MGKALNATGRPILYSLCNWGVDGPWNFAPTIANSWRTSGDLTNVWDQADVNCPCAELDGLDCKLPGYHCSVMNVLNKAVYYPSKAYAGAWNDLDMLGEWHPTRLRSFFEKKKKELKLTFEALEMNRGGKWRLD